jgi:hypothetical protein
MATTDPQDDQFLHIADLRSGRNGSDPPGSLREDECAEALNVDFYHARVGRKRNGATTFSTANSSFDSPIEALYQHVPTSDDSKAELWAQDANGHIAQFVTGAWAPHVPIDMFVGNALTTRFASLDGKLIVGGQYATDTFGKYRLHLWDANTAHGIRRAGIGPSIAAPVAVDNATGGSYPSTARFYRTRWVERAYFGSWAQALAVGNATPITTQTLVAFGANTYASGFAVPPTTANVSFTVNANLAVTCYAAGAGGSGGASNSTFGGSGGGAGASTGIGGVPLVLITGKTYSVAVGQSGTSNRQTFLHNDTDGAYIFQFAGGANGVINAPGGAGGTVIVGTGLAGAPGANAGGAGGTTISYLVVAGGGGGGNNGDAGGGGGGGVLSGTDTVAAGSFAVVVGAGGVSGANGTDSTFNGHDAIGGGAGGTGDTGSGQPGGSGGGAAWYAAGAFGTGTAGQGFSGGVGRAGGASGFAGGGGGGAGGVGGNAGDTGQNIGGIGGVGVASSISGAAKQYAGGGGAGGDSGGGVGGDGANVTGGTGAASTGAASSAGAFNTGGGGGGSAQAGHIGSAGGSGVVIISYATGTFTATGGAITTAGGNTIHTFITSGTWVVSSGGGGAGGAALIYDIPGIVGSDAGLVQYAGGGHSGAPAGAAVGAPIGPPFDGLLVFNFFPQTWQTSVGGGFATTNNTPTWTPTGAVDPSQFLAIGQPVLIDSHTYVVTTVNSSAFTTTPNAIQTYASVSVQPQSSVVVRRSEPSPSVSFTPSGAKTGVNITHPFAPGDGETHWELEGSLDDATYYQLVTFPVTYPTFISDTVSPTNYALSQLSDIVGTYNVPSQYKFVVADQNRLLGFGSWNPSEKQNRIWFSMILGTSVLTGVYPGAAEAVPLGNYLDLDENDSGAPTGLVGPFNGYFLAFKTNQLWKLTPTGNPAAPYSKFAISKKIGALPRTIIVAEDELGNPCVYWQTERGPYRYTVNSYGISQVEYIGYEVEDLIVGPTSTLQTLTGFGTLATLYLNHTVFVPDKRQVWFFMYVNGPTEPYVKLVYNIGRSKPPTPSGWSVHRGPSAQAYASVLFANTVGADTSRDQKPYVGTTTANTVWKCDSGKTDAGTPFQGLITSRAYTSGLHRNMTVNRSWVLAKAMTSPVIPIAAYNSGANGFVIVTTTVPHDFSTNTAVTISQCLFTSTFNGTFTVGVIDSLNFTIPGVLAGGPQPNPGVVTRANPNTTLTQTLIGDYGLQTTIATANLAPSGSETRLRRRFDDSGMAGIGSVQFTWGDATATDMSWKIDECVVETLPLEIA